MANHLAEISVVIPVREGESPAPEMLTMLEREGAEIIISAEQGRATSMNTGAANSSRKFLWFLHADTTLPENAAQKLQQSLQNDEGALHYFYLQFDTDGAMKLNSWGANMRSRIFGTPFGDQGFCIRKDLFFSLGGYSENAQYGEDHLLVWTARRHSLKLRRVDATLTTSARAYEGQMGLKWLKLTLLRQWLWIKQALPQLWLLVRGK